ncbi:hypothetical protein QN277_019548 [Acacia crassicarpa]|uniref:SIAH-type domain-containing protein n=1 Tax=Acacia crassicarpa TaxID=499986 RepID=A0AAE1JM29_9FABA|nr:hypothetical protein QN277_019548 [Acacia crassicarpa]
MARSPGEGPSRNNNSPIRKRPRITVRHRNGESEERHVVEAQGGCTNHQDRESNTGEERERQNEGTREDAEEAEDANVEEEAEDANVEEEAEDANAEEEAEDANADEEAEDANAEEEAEDANAEEEAVGVQVEEEEEESEEIYEVVDVEEEVASGGDGGGGRDESISVTLTDQDILNCCICCEPLATPVYQCKNGHIACSTCCVRIAHKCYSCREPISHIRCRAIEKVIGSIKLSCRYARHGCIEKITHFNKSIHEKGCIYTPCWCPIDGCQFTAPSKKLPQHINHEHQGSVVNFHYDSLLHLKLGLNQKIVVLKELTDSNLFVIRNGQEQHMGNMFNVFHIGPESSAEMYEYELFARSQGCSLKLESFVNHTLGNNFPATTKFLLVPTDFLGPSPALEIEIRIYKVYESSRCG